MKNLESRNSYNQTDELRTEVFACTDKAEAIALQSKVDQAYSLEQINAEERKEFFNRIQRVRHDDFRDPIAIEDVQTAIKENIAHAGLDEGFHIEDPNNLVYGNQ